jgi:hypothetical protein
MASLLLVRLQCSDRESVLGSDTVEIVAWVNGVANRVNVGDMDAGQTRAINREIRFNHSVVVQVNETTGLNAQLGEFTVTQAGASTAEQRRQMTDDSSFDYTLWYRVVPGESSEEVRGAQEAQQREEERRQAERVTTTGGRPLGNGCVGSGAVECDQGQLIVQVRTPDGQPIDGATVSANGAGPLSAANGRYDFGLRPPGAYQIVASKTGYSPRRVEAQATVRKPRTVAEVHLSPVRGVRVAPAAPGYRQFVNMAQGNNASHFGRQIEITATVDPPTEGVRVHFTLDPDGNGDRLAGAPDADPNNRRNLPADQKASLTPASDVTDVHGVARTRLTLSTFGGDRFRVGASLTAGNPPSTYSGWFTVWRMLFFDVVEMERPSGGGVYEMKPAILTAVRAGMADVFIQLEDTGVRTRGPHVRNFETPEAGFQWAEDDDRTSDVRVPQKLHLAVIDSACPGSGTYGPQPLDEAEAITTTGVSTFTIFPHDFAGDDSWLLSAQYQDGATWRDFAAGKVRPVGARGTRPVRFDFSGATVAPTAAQPVNVKIRYRKAFRATGWGGSNSLHLLICRGVFEDMMTVETADRRIVGTALHEPGHALGLVPASAAWHDAAHTRHCTTNTCHMWYENTPARVEFHPAGCGDTLRGVDLTAAALQPRWRFPRS